MRAGPGEWPPGIQSLSEEAPTQRSPLGQPKQKEAWRVVRSWRGCWHKGNIDFQETGGALLGAKVWGGGDPVLGGWGVPHSPSSVAPALLTAPWSHTLLLSSHRMRFRGLSLTSWLSSLCQILGPAMSPPDLSEAADSMNHFLSLLAGFLTERKKPFC